MGAVLRAEGPVQGCQLGCLCYFVTSRSYSALLRFGSRVTNLKAGAVTGRCPQRAWPLPG